MRPETLWLTSTSKLSGRTVMSHLCWMRVLTYVLPTVQVRRRCREDGKGHRGVKAEKWGGRWGIAATHSSAGPVREIVSMHSAKFDGLAQASPLRLTSTWMHPRPDASRGIAPAAGGAGRARRP